jgi:hypothetical protein
MNCCDGNAQTTGFKPIIHVFQVVP